MLWTGKRRDPGAVLVGTGVGLASVHASERMFP